MTLTRERKVLASVLGLGLAVFAADRLFLGGGSEPADAAAGTTSLGTASATVAGAATAAMSLPEPNEQSIARRLARYAESVVLNPAGVREAFIPAESWVPRVDPTASASVKAVVAAPDPRVAFLAKHRLSAVAGAGANVTAIVDGMPVRLGQEFGGFRLVDVTARSAVFESAAGRVELRLRR